MYSDESLLLTRQFGESVENGDSYQLWRRLKNSPYKKY